MAEKTTHNKKTTNESADNLSQQENASETQVNEQAESADTTEAPVADANEEKIKKMQTEIDELRDKNLRLVAEFDNFRRRTAKEHSEMRTVAGKDIIQSLLVVMDDVDRASKQIETSTDIGVVKEGISLVFNKLRTILQQKGLKAMEAQGQEFDADLHEAITEIPAPSEEMKGKVIDVVEKGYYLNDKLIRHAKVVVGK